MKKLANIFGLSIMWYLGKLIVEILDEVIFMRLHQNKYYNILTGKKKAKTKKQSKVQSITGMKMGF